MKKVEKLDYYDAVLFDLDGVLTETAKIHAACWKKMFDNFLQKHAAKTGNSFKPFSIKHDYKLYVDGKLREEGVSSFLNSRNIHLNNGALDDPPDITTIHSLANLKFNMVQDVLKSDGVEAYEGSLALLQHLCGTNMKMAVVSSSKSCKKVLKAAGIINMFDEIVDGETSAALKIPGKPAPDTYLKAAEMLKVLPERSVVVEDAISGVQAGSSGEFGLVIGVARENNAEELKENGADMVVTDLSELLF
jgi:beta-phosphoglucomutase family hydrolase